MCCSCAITTRYVSVETSSEPLPEVEGLYDDIVTNRSYFSLLREWCVCVTKKHVKLLKTQREREREKERERERV